MTFEGGGVVAQAFLSLSLFQMCISTEQRSWFSSLHFTRLDLMFIFVGCSTLTPGHDAVQKVTLIPRGQARGLTWFIPGEDPSLISKQQIFARIVGALGGRATEEVVFGDAEVTTGAASDLQQVTSMAKQVSVPQRLMIVSLASKLEE